MLPKRRAHPDALEQRRVWAIVAAEELAAVWPARQIALEVELEGDLAGRPYSSRSSAATIAQTGRCSSASGRACFATSPCGGAICAVWRVACALPRPGDESGDRAGLAGYTRSSPGQRSYATRPSAQIAPARGCCETARPDALEQRPVWAIVAAEDSQAGWPPPDRPRGRPRGRSGGSALQREFFGSDYRPDRTLLERVRTRLFRNIPVRRSDLRRMASSVGCSLDQVMNPTIEPGRLGKRCQSWLAGDPTAPTSLIRPVLTSNSYGLGTTDESCGQYSCLEMDDGLVARAASHHPLRVGSSTDVSDPVVNATLDGETQKKWSATRCIPRMASTPARTAP